MISSPNPGTTCWLTLVGVVSSLRLYSLLPEISRSHGAFKAPRSQELSFEVVLPIRDVGV